MSLAFVLKKKLLHIISMGICTHGWIPTHRGGWWENAALSLDYTGREMMHDLSKYSPSGSYQGVKYYRGWTHESPNVPAWRWRCFKAWLHHRGGNKHHFEYWMNYDVDGNNTILAGMKMPVKVCCWDVLRQGCSMSLRIYNKNKITKADPLDYYIKGLRRYIMHRKQMNFFTIFWRCLLIEGEEYTFAYIENKY